MTNSEIADSFDLIGDILDFQGDIYGAHLSVAFMEQLRGTQRFASVDELRLQIERDVATARSRIAR